MSSNEKGNTFFFKDRVNPQLVEGRSYRTQPDGGSTLLEILKHHCVCVCVCVCLCALYPAPYTGISHLNPKKKIYIYINMAPET